MIDTVFYGLVLKATGYYENDTVKYRITCVKACALWMKLGYLRSKKGLVRIRRV